MESVVLFDGVCNLCNGAVRFIAKRDPRGEFRFASLQSPVGGQLLAQHGLAPNDLGSIVLIEEGKVYRKSSAALRIARRLSAPWPMAALFLAVPAPIRDFVYEFIARRRYRWFGRTEQCALPADDLRDRFLAPVPTRPTSDPHPLDGSIPDGVPATSLESKYTQFLLALAVRRGAALPWLMEPTQYPRPHELFPANRGVPPARRDDPESSSSADVSITHGDFGIGSFANWSGEMVLCEGQMYRIDSEASVHLATPSAELSLATLVSFRDPQWRSLSNADSFDALHRQLEATMPASATFAAVWAQVTLRRLVVRCLPASAGADHLPDRVRIPQFEILDVTGMLVGFRFPIFAGETSLPGYHLHFLSGDKRWGGHVLDLRLQSGKVAIDAQSPVWIDVPTADAGAVSVPASLPAQQQLTRFGDA